MAHSPGPIITRFLILFLPLVTDVSAQSSIELLPKEISPAGQRFTLDVQIVGQGTLTLSPGGGVYNAGTQVLITALPEEQWEFESWQGSADGRVDPLLVTMDSDKSIIATFVETPLAHFALSVSVIGEGTVEVTPAGQDFLEDTQVQLKAVPASGWQFSSWSGDLATARNPSTITMNADKNISAVFTSNRPGQTVVHEQTITGVSAGGGSVTTGGEVEVSPDHLYVAAISTRPRRSVNEVVGSGLKWQRLVSQCAGRNRTGVDMWWALGGEIRTGTIKAQLAGVVDHAVIAISDYSGVTNSSQLSESFGFNTNGVSGTCTGGTDAHEYQIDLKDLPVGATLYSAVSLRNRDHEPGNDFVGLAQVHSGTRRVAGLAIQTGVAMDNGRLNLSGQFDDTVDWAIGAVVINPNGNVSGQGKFTLSTVKKPVAGGEILLNPEKDIYKNGEIVLVEARPNSGFTFVGWEGDLKGYQSSIALLMDNNKSIKALFRPRPVPREDGILISMEEIKSLAISGIAWDNMKAEADKETGSPDLSNKDDPVNVRVLAKAFVFARTGVERYRDEVIQACLNAIDTEKGGRTLALGRELVAYIVAADIVKLPPEVDDLFKTWLKRTLTEVLTGKTLRTTHEDRPNNWGTNAGASRAAVARYLGDSRELARTALIFKGYLGDRASYADFDYGELSWQVDEANPVGVNPKGAVKNGFSVDGVLPDDMRRGGRFQVPPAFTGYPWGALQGTVVQAEILYRAGYDSWSWQDQAILRSVQFLFTLGWPASGDDDWIPWIINARYGSSFPTQTPTNSGKNFGWMDWLYGGRFGLTVSELGNGRGEVEVVSTGRDATGNTILQLTAIPNVTSVFSRWSGIVNSQENPLRLTLTHDTHLSAVFEKQLERNAFLSVETVGEGRVELSPTGGSYAPGTAVKLTALPANGWEFIGWQGALQGSENPTTIIVDADKTVQADFSRIPIENQTLIIHPVADAYIKANRNTNFGAIDFLKVRTGGTVFRSLLKFVVDGIVGTPSSTKLRLYVVTGGPDGGEIQSVSNNFSDGSGPWLEDAVIWSNAPPFKQEPLQLAGEVTAGTWVEFDVSSVIQSDGTFSFGLKNADATVVKYGSRENVNSPELIVELGQSGQNPKPQKELSKLLSTMERDLLPTEFSLRGNYPNPFNLETTIEYDLPIPTSVTLIIYNLRGQIVRTLVNEFQEAGSKSIQWDGRNSSNRIVGSGIYFLRLNTGRKLFTQKILLQK